MKKYILILSLIIAFSSCKQDFYVFDMDLYKAYQNETGKEVPQVQMALKNYREEKGQDYPEFKPFVFPAKTAKNLYRPPVPVPCFCPAPIMPRSQYDLKKIRFYTYATDPQDINARIISDGKEITSLKPGKMDEESRLIPLRVRKIGDLQTYRDLKLVINTYSGETGEMQLLLDIYKNVIRIK